jgi:hypothetical protein
MARLSFATAGKPGWHREILAASGELGVPVAVIAVVSHLDRERLAALATLAGAADPALAWSPDPGDRATRSAAGLLVLDAHLAPAGSTDGDR